MTNQTTTASQAIADATSIESPVFFAALAGNFETNNSNSALQVQGPHRFIKIGGKAAYHPLSLKTTLKIPSDQHCKDRGSFVLWLSSLESLAISPPLAVTAKHSPNWQDYELLYDNTPGNDVNSTIFSWYWRSFVHPQMVAKFMQGAAGGPAADFGVTPYVPVEHMFFREHEWYQLVFTFDKPASRFCIYMNGILCATTKYPFQCQAPHPELYLGNPAMAFADFAVYDKELTSAQVVELWQAGTAPKHQHTQQELLELYTVQPKPLVDWEPTVDWQLRYDKTLTNLGDFDGWTQQGCMVDGITLEANDITPTGLLLQTPDEIAVETRVYFWSPEVYEGDLAVEFEFMPEQETGLALLVLQAAGMHGEDFLTDHPRRVTGSMHTILDDQIKNYHWEFFRHAVDVRNDVGTHVVLKNPWWKGMGMSSSPLLGLNQWHKLQFVQEGARLRCGMNGQWMLDMQDDAFSHCGPVLHSGRIGIRLMYGTKMRFRNIKIWNRKLLDNL
jgi:hypothetical protein